MEMNGLLVQERLSRAAILVGFIGSRSFGYARSNHTKMHFMYIFIDNNCSNLKLFLIHSRHNTTKQLHCQMAGNSSDQPLSCPWCAKILWANMRFILFDVLYIYDGACVIMHDTAWFSCITHAIWLVSSIHAIAVCTVARNNQVVQLFCLMGKTE